MDHKKVFINMILLQFIRFITNIMK